MSMATIFKIGFYSVRVQHFVHFSLSKTEALISDFCCNFLDDGSPPLVKRTSRLRKEHLKRIPELLYLITGECAY